MNIFRALVLSAIVSLMLFLSASAQGAAPPYQGASYYANLLTCEQYIATTWWYAEGHYGNVSAPWCAASHENGVWRFRVHYIYIPDGSAYTLGDWPFAFPDTSPSPGKNNGPPCACAGDPINLATGSEYREDVDLSLSHLEFRRFYNGGSVLQTRIGNKWRHSFDRSLTFLDDGTVGIATVYRDNGRQLTYVKQDGAWWADPDVADRLSPVTNDAGSVVGWTYDEASSRNHESYDAQGHLQAIADQAGQVTTLIYSDSNTPASVAPTAGLLLKVVAPSGRQLSLTYNAQGNVATVTQPDGGVTSYAYDGAGNLTSVTYPDTRSRTYVYNEQSLTGGNNFPSAITGEIGEDGLRFADLKYDFRQRVILTRLAGGAELTSVSYNNNGNATVIYPTGATATSAFVVSNGVLKAGSLDTSCGTSCGQPYAKQTYDPNGYPASSTDFNGHVIQSAYSAQGLLVSQVEASGESSQRTTSTAWDTTNRVPLTRSVADASGAIQTSTAWVYNSRAQVTARCDIDPSVTSYTCATTGTPPARVRRTTYTYCDAVDTTQCPLVGLLLSTTGPRTDLTSTTRYTYYLTTDESGCGTAGGTCQRAGDLYQVTDAIGHVTTMAAYDKNGRVVRQKDTNGVITDLTYHPRGWLLTRTVRANADGSASANDAVTQIGYTPYGAVASITDPDGVSVSYTYDPAHRLTDITDALGNRIHYTLDAAGNKTKEETFDTGGTLRRSLARTYNTLGQLTGVKDGLSRTVFDASFSDSYDANGNLVRSADALGIQRKQGYDGLNRLVSTLDNYNGTDAATQNTQSVFAYDARDQLLGVGDPDGLNTTYDYDGLGNATAVHSPDTGTTQVVYDAAGNRTQTIDAKGTVSTSTYDALNRLTAVSYADATLNVAYHYDEPDTVTGCVGSRPVGRLTRVIETAVSTTYCYDARGNVVQKRQTQGTQTDTTAYSYTLADRLASTLTPGGTSIQYNRDAAGRISSVTALPPGTTGAGAGNVVTNIGYLPFGPIASYTLGNGQTITRSYDANYALTDVTSPALNLHFARDAMGNPIALGNAPGANPAIETYSYDPLYRLTGITGPNSESYTYSKTGDRLSKVASGLATGTYGYQSGTHWLTSIGSSARTYDANGNTTGSATGGETFGYGYNGRNRMTVVQRNNQTVATYSYNAMGQRVAKGSTFPQAVNQRFAYDEASQLIGEYGTTNRDYIWLGDLPVAVVDTAGTASTVSYVHADGLGTPRAVTDATGTAIWQWSYAGNAFEEQEPISAMGYIFNLRSAGEYYDAESGLNSNGYRTRDRHAWRFLQSDPIGLAGGMSTYAAVGNRPLRSVDPDGLQVAGTGHQDWVNWSSSNSEAHANVLQFFLGANPYQVNPPGDDSIQPVLTPFEFMFAGGVVRSVGVASSAMCGAAEGASTNLFRAVGPAELADIHATNAFRNLGSAEGKYFTTSAMDASSYAKQAVNGFGDLPYTLIETRVPKNIFTGLSPARVDRGIPAWVIPSERLPGLVPTPLNSMPIPH